MRSNYNREHVEGYVYQHDLAVKTVQNKDSENYGKEFIAGTLEVAVDEAGLNVIPVHFTYVTETNSKGTRNATYTNLKKIIDENKTWIAVGKDNAQKVKIDTALALNDFYAQDGNLVSMKVNEGGFVTLVSVLCDETQRNTWKADMLITGVNRVEADPEKNINADYLVVKGAIFNFRNAILPMEFKLTDERGFGYFENLGATQAEPVYTQVWGVINCESKTTTIKEESAFGEPAVRTVEKKSKEWLITGTFPESKVYEFGTEETMTAEDIQKAVQDREVMLADVKKRADEYKASKNSAIHTPATATPVAKPGVFSF